MRNTGPANRGAQGRQAKNVLSMHPVIKGDAFSWDRAVLDRDLFRAIKEADAVILPQTVERELYCLCSRICPTVFPNYDLRFQWEGKTGDTLAFWTYDANHPYTLVFPRVETLVGKHDCMKHRVPPLPPYPFVLKGAHGGGGSRVWLIEDEWALKAKLQTLLQYELHGRCGFVIQEFLAGLERDLRVVVIGDRLVSYWRTSRNFRHNVARGGEIDAESDQDLQEAGRKIVKRFCLQTGVNLAAFDLVFPAGDTGPLFLEINYTFGRTGLGGTENFYMLLQEAVDRWLQDSFG